MTDGQHLAIGHNKEYWDGDGSKLEAINVCGTDGHYNGLEREFIKIKFFIKQILCIIMI